MNSVGLVPFSIPGLHAPSRRVWWPQLGAPEHRLAGLALLSGGTHTPVPVCSQYQAPQRLPRTQMAGWVISTSQAFPGPWGREWGWGWPAVEEARGLRHIPEPPWQRPEAPRLLSPEATPAASVLVPTLWPLWNLYRFLFYVNMMSAGQGHWGWRERRD